jgi:hypothetical protein
VLVRLIFVDLSGQALGFLGVSLKQVRLQTVSNSSWACPPLSIIEFVRDVGPRTYLFTYFTILGAIVCIVGLYGVLDHNTRSGVSTIIVGVCVIAVAEWLSWRYDD